MRAMWALVYHTPIMGQAGGIVNTTDITTGQQAPHSGSGRGYALAA